MNTPKNFLPFVGMGALAVICISAAILFSFLTSTSVSDPPSPESEIEAAAPQAKLPLTTHRLHTDIPMGERALKISADDHHGIPDHLRFNDRVDLSAIWTVANEENSRPRPTAVSLLQNVTVFDVDEDHNLTLQMTPEEVQLISLATSHSKLIISARNPDDLEVVTIKSTHLAELIDKLEHLNQPCIDRYPDACPYSPPEIFPVILPRFSN